MRQVLATLIAAVMALSAPGIVAGNDGRDHEYEPAKARTPIKHLVVIFDENVSFDHYFGIYPKAINPTGDPKFVAAADTPKVNGFTPELLQKNPNLNSANGSGAANPFRLGRTQASTNDQDNDYSPEQMAFHGGKLDLFPLNTGAPGNALGNLVPKAPAPFNTNGLTMAYFDGNTVTALWNYAQHYAMSD